MAFGDFDFEHFLKIKITNILVILNQNHLHEGDWNQILILKSKSCPTRQ